jgi:hypothetical protein
MLAQLKLLPTALLPGGCGAALPPLRLVLRAGGGSPEAFSAVAGLPPFSSLASAPDHATDLHQHVNFLQQI